MKTPLHILHLENDPKDAAVNPTRLGDLWSRLHDHTQSRGRVARESSNVTHIGKTGKARPTFGHDARRAKNREGSIFEDICRLGLRMLLKYRYPEKPMN
jgi:hypothetical protein